LSKPNVLFYLDVDLTASPRRRDRQSPCHRDKG